MNSVFLGNIINKQKLENAQNFNKHYTTNLIVLAIIFGARLIEIFLLIKMYISYKIENVCGKIN